MAEKEAVARRVLPVLTSAKVTCCGRTILQKLAVRFRTVQAALLAWAAQEAANAPRSAPKTAPPPLLPDDHPAVWTTVWRADGLRHCRRAGGIPCAARTGPFEAHLLRRCTINLNEGPPSTGRS
ncbi:MAG: hypothetical protein U0452_06965 [Anaerolineae bacterium]